MIKKILSIKIGNRKLSTILLWVVAICAFTYAIIQYNQMKENRVLIEDKLTAQMNYSKSNRPTDLAYLTQMEKRNGLNYQQKGIIQERRAYIYGISNQAVDYYKAVGTALFYLLEAEDYNRLLYIYSDMANRYLNNGDYRSVSELLDEAERVLSLAEDGTVYPENLSYYYRMKGLYARMIGNFEEAHAYLQKAMNEVGTIDLPVYHTDYKRRSEILGYYIQIAGVQDILTSVYERGKALQLAEEALQEYSYMELNSQSQYYEMLASEYNLPFLEANIRIANEEKQFEKAKDYIRQYTALCSLHGFSQRRMNMWLFYQNMYMENFDDGVDSFYVEIGAAYSTVANDLNREYMSVMSAEVEDAMTNVAAREQTRVDRQRRSLVYLIIIAIALGASGVVASILNKNKFDALTGISNRRALDAYLTALDRKHDDISGIMIDVDNFKSVNDTYGHDVGDEVLKNLGSILAKRDDGDTRAYRYGGEEFAILTSFQQHLSVVELAESIRRDVENSTWPQGLKITISLGVATHLSPEKVLTEADSRLYFAKHNGKNVVCYMRNGEDTLYKDK